MITNGEERLFCTRGGYKSDNVVYDGGMVSKWSVAVSGLEFDFLYIFLLCFGIYLLLNIF